MKSRLPATAIQFLALILITVATLIIASQSFAQQDDGISLPPGFEYLKIVRLEEYEEALGMDMTRRASDMVFLPNNDILIGDKGRGDGLTGTSYLWLVQNGELQLEPVVSISTNVFGDAGLNSITIDNNFAENGYIYVWYAAGSSAKDWDGTAHVRLSRFTFDFDTNTASPDSELILLKTDYAGHVHHGHALHMDNEGHLYIGTGDSSIPSTEQVSFNLSILEGKILRIIPTETGYTIPADNPYIDTPDARPEIYAIGLRNTFRFAERESDGLFVIGDVGGSTYEEVNIVQPGVNYGWPLWEGPCKRGTEEPCSGNSAYTNPLFYYPHGGEGRAVTGLDFYEGTAFPEEYHDQLFFADVALNNVGVFKDDRANSTGFDEFLTGGNTYVDVTYHRDSIYVLSNGLGEVGQIFYTGSENTAPTASLAASQTVGEPGTTVDFTASVTDPDDTVFSYVWDFGDGSATITTTSNTVSHLFSSNGTFQTSLQVVDARGARSSAVEQTITIYDGEFATINLEIVGVPDRTEYDAGDTLQFSAERSNLDGLDPDVPYTWEVVFHHLNHVHPFISAVDSISGTVSLPQDNHDGDYELWYRVVLTMNTDDGQKISISKEIFPRLADITFETTPIGGRISLNSVEEQTPITIRSVVGLENSAVALPDLLSGQSLFAPSYWEWGNMSLEGDTLSLVTPVTNQTYRAVYSFDREAPKTFLPVITSTE